MLDKITVGGIVLTIFVLLFLANSIDTNLVEQVPSATNDIPSPQNRIEEEQILVTSDNVVINVKNLRWAKFTDTNSMDPVIDSEANSLEVVPTDESEVHIGDIISYESVYGVLIHRVIDIKEDEKGIYYIVKGDNNETADPFKVRFADVTGIVVGVLY